MVDVLASISESVARLGNVGEQIVVGIVVAFIGAVGAGIWWLVRRLITGERLEKTLDERAKSLLHEATELWREAQGTGIGLEDAIAKARRARDLLGRIARDFRGTEVAGELLRVGSDSAKLRAEIEAWIPGAEARQAEKEKTARNAQRDRDAIITLQSRAALCSETPQVGRIIEVAGHAERELGYRDPGGHSDDVIETRRAIINALYTCGRWDWCLAKVKQYSVASEIRALIEARRMEEAGHVLEGVDHVRQARVSTVTTLRYLAEAAVRAAERSDFDQALAIAKLEPEGWWPLPRAITLAIKEGAFYQAAAFLPHIGLRQRAGSALEIARAVQAEGRDLLPILEILDNLDAALSTGAAQAIAQGMGGVHNFVEPFCELAEAFALIGERARALACVERAEPLAKDAYPYWAEIGASMNIAIAQRALGETDQAEQAIAHINDELTRQLGSNEAEQAATSFIADLVRMGLHERALLLSYLWAHHKRFEPLAICAKATAETGLIKPLLVVLKRLQELPPRFDSAGYAVLALRRADPKIEGYAELLSAALTALDRAPFGEIKHHWWSDRQYSHIKLLIEQIAASRQQPWFAQVRARLLAGAERFRAFAPFGRCYPLLVLVAEDGPKPSPTWEAWP